MRRVTVARNYANEIVFANGTRSSKGNYSRVEEGVQRASLSLDEVSLPIPGGRELEIGEISQLSIVPLLSPLTVARNNFFSLDLHTYIIRDTVHNFIAWPVKQVFIKSNCYRCLSIFFLF